jgi:D-glycero-alpha-D-manno-heptose 1-phosphate guanylyltransferase
MEAIVLVGGLGTRLRGVVNDVPKPMAPVCGRPLLAFALDRLVDAGFGLAVLAAGYGHEAIRAHFGDEFHGLALTYSVEREPLGTGGAIRLALDQIRSPDVFVLNGDTYLELDYRGMLEAHAQAGAQLSLAVCEVPDVARYGALKISDGIVRGFREKGETGPGWINGGTYVFGPELRDRLPSGAFSLEQELLVPQVESLQPLAFPTSGLFIDIGTPGDYLKAQELLSARVTR